MVIVRVECCSVGEEDVSTGGCAWERSRLNGSGTYLFHGSSVLMFVMPVRRFWLVM